MMTAAKIRLIRLWDGISHTGIPGLWTLDSGRQTVDVKVLKFKTAQSF